jgi:hypothetical protein
VGLGVSGDIIKRRERVNVDGARDRKRLACQAGKTKERRWMQMESSSVFNDSSPQHTINENM